MVPSVLIVDDEKHTREGLQQALQEHYDVSVAANTDEAFNLMDAQPYEVIITDLRMPGKSGLKIIDKALALAKADLQHFVIYNTIFVNFLQGVAKNRTPKKIL